MAEQPKNVDGISKPQVIKGKGQYKKGDPLISIIEPETPKEPVFEAPKPDQDDFTKIQVKKPSVWRKQFFVTKGDRARYEKKPAGDNVETPELPAAKSEKVKEPKVKKEKWSKSFFGKNKNAPEPGSENLAVTQNDNSKTEKEPIFKKRHKIAFGIGVFLLVFVAFAGLIGGGAYAHQAMYENKVFPGVVVWGEKVGGKSTVEVQQLITDKMKNYAVTIKGPDQDYTAKAGDLGIVFKTETMALSAYTKGRSNTFPDDYFTRARLLLTAVPWQPWQTFIRAKDLAIAPSYSVDDAKLTDYLGKVADNIKINPQDSQITVNGSSVQLKPAIYGRTVKVDELKKNVLASIRELRSAEVDTQVDQLKPAIIDNSAQEVMLQAQNVMARPVVLTYQGNEYRPNQETVASWITFTKQTGDTKYTLVIDKSKMANYFKFLGTKINVYSTPRIVRVENNVNETETQAGVDGLLVDTSLLGNQIATQLPVLASVNLQIPTYVDKFKTQYNRVIVANWDKYIDIDIASQTMMACERGGVNCHSWKITSGNDSHATPLGTFLVLGKSAFFYMTGGTPGIDYYKVWVDHATWFTSAGHAIHDAHWRNGSFGGQDYHWNGSHGCINAPDDAAIYVYNWADVGTPVTIH